MPVPAGTTRININASLEGGELMVHTLHVLGLNGAGDFRTPNVQEITDKVRDGWQSFINGSAGVGGIKGALHTNTVYTSVAGYQLDPVSGNAQFQALSQFTAATKGLVSSSLPTEVAMAVSLITGRAGRTGRGRFYLGGLGAGLLTPQGRFQAAETAAVGTAFAGFANGIRQPGLDFQGCRLVVLSRTANINSDVLEVRVGDVPDVQRRRRNRLRETYSSSLL